MKPVVSIGKQDFQSLRENEYFYIDKTDFIKEWWESGDEVTLITRPRRFGKTLNMSMLECFFSKKYEKNSDLFEGLHIWEEEKYKKLQGTYPVIFLSFADVKQGNYKDAVKKLKGILAKLYDERYFLADWEGLTPNEKRQFLSVGVDMDDVTAQDALKNLCNYLSRYYQKKVLIFLDEYDTPMQEAYLGKYWNVFTDFIRSMFNATFKTNPFLERALLTGITQVSKESIFSDLNNLKVITTTSNQYETSFGFTEEEVISSLQYFNLAKMKQDVKEWYDGFSFGRYTDIYNPWSITNFLDEGNLKTFWASTSSNGLINRLLQISSSEIKKKMEDLVKGESIQVMIDEQIIFNQLDEDENAIWSLMLASGYLKVDVVQYKNRYGEELDEPIYSLSITNREVRSMFVKMFKGWFRTTSSSYNGFIRALLKGNRKEMNAYMNEVALATFSSFDTGNHPSKKLQPERFYHGFVLGLLVELRGNYEVLSNGESGYGRYDVMLCPLKEDELAFVLEFKVHDPDAEKTLKDTVDAALFQIEEMRYDTKLLERGVKKENIRHYGFAFERKTVLIG
jgi:hypothetical protein